MPGCLPTGHGPVRGAARAIRLGETKARPRRSQENKHRCVCLGPGGRTSPLPPARALLGARGRRKPAGLSGPRGAGEPGSRGASGSVRGRPLLPRRGVRRAQPPLRGFPGRSPRFPFVSASPPRAPRFPPSRGSRALRAPGRRFPLTFFFPGVKTLLASRRLLADVIGRRPARRPRPPPPRSPPPPTPSASGGGGGGGAFGGVRACVSARQPAGVCVCAPRARAGRHSHRGRSGGSRAAASSLRRERRRRRRRPGRAGAGAAAAARGMELASPR